MRPEDAFGRHSDLFDDVSERITYFGKKFTFAEQCAERMKKRPKPSAVTENAAMITADYLTFGDSRNTLDHSIVTKDIPYTVHSFLNAFLRPSPRSAEFRIYRGYAPRRSGACKLTIRPLPVKNISYAEHTGHFKRFPARAVVLVDAHTAFIYHRTYPSLMNIYTEVRLQDSILKEKVSDALA